jgi:hypothetical protein
VAAITLPKMLADHKQKQLVVGPVGWDGNRKGKQASLQ